MSHCDLQPLPLELSRDPPYTAVALVTTKDDSVFYVVNVIRKQLRALIFMGYIHTEM